MRVIMRTGHFAFYPRRAADISRFMNLYDLELIRVEDFYTFPRLVDAPDYSLADRPLLNLIANETFEGKPWEVLAANEYVYHIETDLLVPAASVLNVIDLPLVGNYYLAQNALIQPGSLLKTGEKILSYDAEYIQENFTLKVLGVDFE